MDVKFFENQHFYLSNSLQGQNLREDNSWDLLNILEPKMPSNSSLEPNISSSSSLKPNVPSNSGLKPNLPSNCNLQLNLLNTFSLNPNIHQNLPNTTELNQSIVSPRNEGIKANSHLEESIDEFHVYSRKKNKTQEE